MKNSSKRRSEDAGDNYSLEKTMWQQGLSLCGVDEAGRGCMAGPVVIAAVILATNTKHELLIDSKKLSPQQLDMMYDWLSTRCIFSISTASARIIDQHNIYQATAQHMKSALLHLLATNMHNPGMIAIDAMPINLGQTPYAHIPIVSMTQGESKSISIAAASIIAKVTRDRIMQRMQESFPGYGLATHKGYCTKLHQSSVLTLQPSITHRATYLNWLIKDQSHEQQTIFC